MIRLSKVNPPVVSILIPVFNRANLLVETLESIINQTFTNWECVLVDDRSDDGSFELLNNLSQTYSRLKVFQRPLNLPKGAGSCRNFAFEKSIGKYIQYFDSDDIMLPNMLEEKVFELEKFKEYDFLVSKMGEFNESGRLAFKDYPLTSSDLMNDFLTYKLFFLTPGPLFKREFLAAFKVKFDEKLHRRQEREFYTRIILSQPSYLALDKVHCLRRLHPESIKSSHEVLSNSAQVWGKFQFYQRLSINTDFEYSNLVLNHFGREISRMILFFLKKGQFFRAFQAMVFHSNLLISAK